MSRVVVARVFALIRPLDPGWTWCSVLALVLGLSGLAPGDTPGPDPDPIDGRAYRIEAHVAIDPDARIDERGREALLEGWRTLAGRFVGAPWDLRIADARSPLSRTAPEALEAGEVAPFARGRDKVWAIRIGRRQAGYEVSGREFDATVRRLGPIRRRLAPFAPDLARELFRFSLDLFTPSAEIGEQAGGGVTLTIQGAALEAASPIGRVAGPGSVFEPFRVVPQREGAPRILRIPFTYLRVDSQDGSRAHAAIVSALRDPLTQRIARKNSLVALGVKPGDRPTRLRFVTRADQAPAAGYVLTARTLPDGPPFEVGTTDRDGRIALEPGFARGLVVLRLLAGSVEPMVELPLMPGEAAEERTIPFDPKPATVALEAQLDSLRDAVIDLVAIRARLEARLKARTEGEDWAGVAETLREFSQLPPRANFAERLARIKDEAVRQQARSKVAILTKTAQAQVAEIQALIDRYLDDEIVRGYAEAAEQAKVHAAAGTKAAPARKPASPPLNPK